MNFKYLQLIYLHANVVAHNIIRGGVVWLSYNKKRREKNGIALAARDAQH